MCHDYLTPGQAPAHAHSCPCPPALLRSGTPATWTATPAASSLMAREPQGLQLQQCYGTSADKAGPTDVSPNTPARCLQASELRPAAAHTAAFPSVNVRGSECHLCCIAFVSCVLKIFVVHHPHPEPSPPAHKLAPLSTCDLYSVWTCMLTVVTSRSCAWPDSTPL